MNKLFLFLSALFSLIDADSIAQHAGDNDCVIHTELSANRDTIHRIRVQPDGKIVAAGNGFNGSYSVIAVGRYNSGVLDPTFGTNGIVTASVGLTHTAANDMDLQQDGKIVIAGSYRNGSVSDFILARYKTNGSPDSSFGINGLVLTDINSGSSDFASALAIQADGKIIAAGSSFSPPLPLSLALCRYKPDGSPDSTFDSDGKLIMMNPGATCMALQPDGKIVVCCGNNVMRLMPDGNLDSGFGTNGIATLNYAHYGMAIQNDGMILLSGGNNQFVTERLTTSGAHDNSFGNGGMVITTGFSNGSAPGQRANAVCVQADGRIIVSGYGQDGNSQDRFFALARYKANGVPDSSFGTAGKVSGYTFQIQGFYSASSFSSAITNDNRVVVAGINDNHISPNEWAMVCYLLGPPLDVPATTHSDAPITVVPNPVEDMARIHSSYIANGNWQLSLIDLTGRTLYNGTLTVMNNTLDKDIPLVSFPVGMYLLKLDNGANDITIKLVKSK